MTNPYMSVTIKKPANREDVRSFLQREFNLQAADFSPTQVFHSVGLIKNDEVYDLVVERSAAQRLASLQDDRVMQVSEITSREKRGFGAMDPALLDKKNPPKGPGM